MPSSVISEVSVVPLYFGSGRRPSSYFSVPNFSVHFFVAGPTTVRRTVDRKIKGQKNESLESCSSLIQAPIFLPLHSFAIRLVAAEGRAGIFVAYTQDNWGRTIRKTDAENIVLPISHHVVADTRAYLPREVIANCKNAE